MNKLLALLPPALLLGLALACGSSGSDGPVTGPRLYMLQGCTTCHRSGGQGGPLGPALRNVSERWTREQLMQYLLDPKGFVDKDARLQSLARSYRMQMPAIRLDEERLGVLVDYVLSL